MKEIKISKGTWRLSFDKSEIVTSPPGIIEGSKIVCSLSEFSKKKEEVEANGNLIADAGNTAQKCGLLPSELLRQRDELKEALIDMMWQFAYRGTYEGLENLHTGGLSALEDAFSALGISDPITVIDFEAAIKSTEQ